MLIFNGVIAIPFSKAFDFDTEMPGSSPYIVAPVIMNDTLPETRIPEAFLSSAKQEEYLPA